MFRKVLCLLATWMLTLPIPSFADVLFEHAYPTTGTPAWCTPCNGYRVWDVFDLSSASSITSIQAQLSTSQPTGYTYTIEYSVWSEDRSTQLFSQTFSWGGLATTALGWGDLGGYRWNVDAAMTGLSLSAGTYALSIFGVQGNDSLAWVQSSETVDGRSYQSMYGNGGGLDMAFRIIGTSSSAAPEPGTLALLGLALAGIAFTRRRKQ